MTSRQHAFVLVACAVCATGERAARAGIFGDTRHDESGYESDAGSNHHWWTEGGGPTGVGIGFFVGAGITGFTDRTLRETTSPVGGLWEFRGAFGTRLPIAFEVGYTGTATSINSLLGPASATLLGTTVEGDVRLNLLPRSIVDPYAFVGIGWTHYSIDNASFRAADTGINNGDDLLEIPVGAGLSYRFARLVTDVRGTFRATRGANLVLEDPTTAQRTGTGAYAPMHAWEASMAVGYEF